MTKTHSELLHRPTTQDKPYVGLGPRPTSWLQRFPPQPQGLSIFTGDCESLPGPPILLQTLAVGATGGQAGGGPTGAGEQVDQSAPRISLRDADVPVSELTLLTRTSAHHSVT